MSGHANFAPIGQNVAPVQMNISGPVAPQPAPQPAPQIEEPPIADGRVPAEVFLRELDVMIAKAAASSAAKGIDADSLARTARAAKITEDAVANLREKAAAAQTAMLKLNAFSGADLANAMKRVEDENGNKIVDWDPDTSAGEVIKEALAAQEELSSALSKLLNALPKKATVQQQEALEEAMLQCDRRIVEIETIVMQVTEIAERGFEGEAIDDKTKARLDGKFVELAGGLSLDKFDRGRALEALHASLDPLVQKLDHYAKHGTDALTKADLKTLTREIDAAKNALAAAAKSGKVSFGGKDVYIADRTFFDEASKVVDAAKRKLVNLREYVGRAAVRKFIENDMPWPWRGEGVLKPEFADDIEALGRQFAPLATVIRKYGAARDAMLAMADNPKNSAFNSAWDIANAISVEEAEAAADAIEALVVKGAAPEGMPEGRFRDELVAFTARCTDDAKRFQALCKTVKSESIRLTVGLEHIFIMARNANSAKEESFLSSGTLRDLFRGERTFSTLVESRLHGYADSDIDPALDDRNVESSRTLGAGAMNCVSLVTFKNGRQAVFKPEVAGRFSACTTPLQLGLAPEQQMSRVNIAVQKTADALGLGDVMVKTTVGVHKGVFGMFMDRAPGVEGGTIANRKRISQGPNGVKPSLSALDIERLPDADFEKVAGRMMRQFNRLEWFDLITGQGDRHDCNYLIQIRPDLTVDVKGIDNDASYGVFRPGLKKFVLTDLAIRRFNKAVEDYAKACGPNNKDAVLAALKNDPGVKRRQDGTIEVDLSKTQNPALTEIVCHGALGGQTVTVPDAIDRDLYDKLVALKSGRQRSEYLAELKSRLGNAQYNAAVSRLDEAIAHAEKLEKEGKVYNADQWETHEVQRKVAALDKRLAVLPPVAGAVPGGEFGTRFLKDYNYTMAPTIFGRDILRGVRRENWFK